MRSLPDPGPLTPAMAGDVLREIRTHWRPRLLEQLEHLYRSEHDAASWPGAILAEEIRLQRLDRYLVSMLSIMKREGPPLGWDSFRPSLRDVRRIGSSCLEADVDLAFTPENHECVHGPFTLVAVEMLARKLLLAGERFAAVERVTWAVPLRHRIRLRVGDSAELPPADRGGAVSGRLSTSFGRRIEFIGVPVADRPLLIQRDYNALSQALVAGRQLVVVEPNRLFLELAPEGLAACRRAVRHRTALCTALVLDVVPIAILNWKRGRPMMCCGYRDVPLPAPPPAAFAAGTGLELRYRADHSHRSSRSGLWIGHYEFRYVPWQTAWSTMVMAESDDVGVLLRMVHS
jgi:hypothetical protein